MLQFPFFFSYNFTETCSRTTLQKEKEVLKEELGFTDEEIEKMQEYAWEARFLK